MPVAERLLDVLRESAVEAVPVRVRQLVLGAARVGVQMRDGLARLGVDLAGKMVDEALRTARRVSERVRRGSRAQDEEDEDEEEEVRAHRVGLARRLLVQLLEEAVHLDEVGLERVEVPLRLAVLGRGDDRDRVFLLTTRSKHRQLAAGAQSGVEGEEKGSRRGEREDREEGEREREGGG